MKEFFENLVFVISHSAYPLPALLVFGCLGFWLGHALWGKWAQALDREIAEQYRLKEKIAKTALGEFFASPGTEDDVKAEKKDQ